LTSFTDLRLAAPILKALEDEGYKIPTPIQAQAIPPVMEGRNLLGIAQTGTGKTAAFALPILHRLAADRRPAPRKGCRVLVLSPTRELCSQIGESFRAYGRHLGITVSVVFGGVAHRPQIQALSRGVDVLVAAPGRLLDLMEQRAADLSGTEIFVLDEADQMLDLGFVKPIRRIVSHLSHRRQNLFFSATMPKEIAGLADELLNDPVKVSVAPVATTAERVRQRVIHIESGKKRALLAELLADPGMTRTLVFTRTKRGADRVARHLEGAGMKAAAIHGNKSQRQREIALEDFKQSRINILVATDIAARGIDIDLVTHVVNYELPEVPEAYVHRIGRTARAGASGIAISLCDSDERDQLRAIERLTRQTIPHEDRRNDPAIVADKTPPSRQDGQPTGNAHRGHRHEGSPRRGDRDRDHRRSPAPRGGERTRDGAHADARNGTLRGKGDGPRGNDDQRPRNGHRHPRPAGSEHRPREARNNDRVRGNEDGGSLHGVAFLARPDRGPGRRDGDRPHKTGRPHDGESRGQADRGHTQRDRHAQRPHGGGQDRPRRPGFGPARQGASRGRDAR
jgi:ATP-dependent RNA helicase RhlE